MAGRAEIRFSPVAGQTFVHHLLQQTGVVGEDPVDPAVDLPEKTAARSNIAGSHFLTFSVKAPDNRTAQQQIVAAKAAPSIAPYPVCAQLGTVFRYGDPRAQGKSFYRSEESGMEAKQMEVLGWRQSAQNIMQSSVLLFRIGPRLRFDLNHQMKLVSERLHDFSEGWNFRKLVFELLAGEFGDELRTAEDSIQVRIMEHDRFEICGEANIQLHSP